MKKSGTLVVALCLSITSQAYAWKCSSSQKVAKADQDIVQTAQAAGQFETLLAAAKAAGLVDALKGKGPLTVFAPTDDAFAKLPQGTIESLLKPENKDQLVSVLTYHVVAQRLDAASVSRLGGAETLNGQRLSFNAAEGTVKVGAATVLSADVRADNGIIHVIDRVLLPETGNLVDQAKGAGKFNTLLAAAQQAGLAEALSGEGPLTVFAPTDEAFDALPEGTVENLLKPENKETLANILKYHVVSGRVYSDEAVKAGSAQTLEGGSVHIKDSAEGVFVQDARVVSADINASNGVIHVIDKVILPN